MLHTYLNTDTIFDMLLLIIIYIIKIYYKFIL
jgi:hypothetical protein